MIFEKEKINYKSFEGLFGRIEFPKMNPTYLSLFTEENSNFHGEILLIWSFKLASMVVGEEGFERILLEVIVFESRIIEIMNWVVQIT